MQPRLLAPTAACLALLVGVWPRALRAAERGCGGPSIQPDARITASFPSLAERVRSELTARADLDSCARVGLQLEGDTVITIGVLLPDGRAASRSVTREEDVVPTLQALLLVPEQVPTLSPVLRPRTPNPASRHREPTAPLPESERDGTSPVSGARSLGFEISVLTGARMGDGQLAAGGGMLSFLDVAHWLVGFQGRVDSYRPLLGGDAETAIELGMLGGRRFDLGSVALDLTAGPAVAVRGATLARSDVVQMQRSEIELPPRQREPEASSGPLPRLLFGVRLGFRPRSVFRTFVGIEGEVGPTRAASDGDMRSGRLPGFCLGLALGATVGTR